MGSNALLLILVAVLVDCNEISTVQSSSKSSSSPATVKSPEEVRSSVDLEIPLLVTESQNKLITSDGRHNSKNRVLKKEEDNEVVPPEEFTDTEYFEAIINEKKRLIESERYSKPDEEDDGDTADELAAEPSEDKVNRQDDVKPQFQRRTNQQSSVDFDDSQQGPAYSTGRNTRGRQTIRDPTASDARPLLQLTQGGYRRPYLGVTRPQRQEVAPRQPERAVENENDNRKDGRAENRDSSSFRTQQPQYVPVPVIQQPFASPGGAVQGYPNSYFSPQQTAVPIPDFATNLQSQFLVGNDVNGYPAFVRDPNIAGEFRSSPMGSYPGGGYYVQQDRPQFVQPQPIITGYQQPQFQTTGFSGFPGFESITEAARPDYSAFYRSPNTLNAPSQVPVQPSAIYGNTPQPGMFSNPGIDFVDSYPPPSAPQYAPRYLRYPASEVKQKPTPTENAQEDKEQQQHKKQNTEGSREDENTEDDVNENRQENKVEIAPFGARLRSQLPQFDNVFLRFPMTEAGYGTQEPLPVQNFTSEENNSTGDFPNRGLPRLFFPERSQIEYPFPRGRDPYRNALSSLQRQNDVDANNRTYEYPSEPFIRNAPPQFAYPQMQGRQPPNGPFFGYPDRSREIPGLSSFYPAGNNELGRTLGPVSGYPFQNSQSAAGSREEANKTPECAKKANASMCFEDENYPRREVLHSLNSDSYVVDRLVSPNQGLEEFVKDSKFTESEDNFVCKVDVKQGRPLRAKNALGLWKVIVNMDATVADGRFVQPVRLEVCREPDEPCSYTNSRVSTKCVQKMTLQRLLAWTYERGIHMDHFRLPVACSCQVLEAFQT